MQFDEFFPMINGFLKSIGVLIEVYTMTINVTVLFLLSKSLNKTKSPKSLKIEFRDGAVFARPEYGREIAPSGHTVSTDE